MTPSEAQALPDDVANRKYATDVLEWIFDDGGKFFESKWRDKDGNPVAGRDLPDFCNDLGAALNLPALKRLDLRVEMSIDPDGLVNVAVVFRDERVVEAVVDGRPARALVDALLIVAEGK